MRIIIEEKILNHFPLTAIGYLLAEVKVTKQSQYVDNLKASLQAGLEQMQINATNFVQHPNIAIWRQIYEESFRVKAKTYRSSLEALVKRVTTGKEIWNINHLVDLYNCCSVLTMLPMGGYDADKVVGDIKIRFGNHAETFLGIGERKAITTESNQIVYADEKRIMCWLWNHKDAQETCIDENTKQVLFFIDSFDTAKVNDAVTTLEHHLLNIGAVPMKRGVLNADNPKAIVGE